MPNMAAIGMVPFIPRSESVSLSRQSTARMKPRMYDEGPLPIKASSSAPRNARIVNRMLDAGVVTFELQIGSTTINDVGLDEVLDYVSMYELEEYENRAFEEERELLRIVKEEQEKLKYEKMERMKERAKRKGVLLQPESSGEGLDAAATEEEDVATGKHGRARPSYKHMYKKFKERRRRKRDPKTGELLPFSDEEEGQALEFESSENEPAGAAVNVAARQGSSRAPLENPIEMPKRRRRKRDPLTGELMPLNPLPQELSRQSEERATAGLSSEPAVQLGEKPKRPRRRRHPLTGELMPLGWRYDPEAEKVGKATQKAAITVPDVKRLSLSQEHGPKRRRLDERSSSEQRSASPAIKANGSARAGGALSAFKIGAVVNLGSSEEDEAGEEFAVVQPTSKPKLKPKLLRRSFGGTSVVQSTATSTAPESSPEPSKDNIAENRASARHVASRSVSQSSRSSTSSIIPLQANSPPSRLQRPVPATSITRPSVAAPATSILQPSATAATGPSSESDSEMAEDEWAIEAILAHGRSDPRTHPAALGKKPVMLYQVKWEGSDELTWEPLSSFESLEPVREYQRMKGLAVEPESEEGD